MKVVIMILMFCPFFAAHPSSSPDEDLIAKEKARLRGTWIIVTATLSGEVLPLKALEKDVKSLGWNFSGETFKAFVGGAKEAVEEGAYEIHVGKSPKHLDLLPKKGELLTTRKCLYSVSGGTLTIAFSVNLAPGTAEEELKRAKEMRETRPKNLQPRRMDSTLILTFKRQKD